MKLPSLHESSLLLALSFGLVACGGDDKKTDSVPCASADAVTAEATYDSLWTHVFSSQCGTCHGVEGNTDTENGPDMTTQDNFYKNLVDVKGSTYATWNTFQINRASCVTNSFIAKSKASSSLVVGVLDSSLDLGACKVKSHKDPPQSVCISSGSLTNLKKWINDGAAK